MIQPRVLCTRLISFQLRVLRTRLTLTFSPANSPVPRRFSLHQSGPTMFNINMSGRAAAIRAPVDIAHSLTACRSRRQRSNSPSAISCPMGHDMLALVFVLRRDLPQALHQRHQDTEPVLRLSGPNAQGVSHQLANSLRLTDTLALGQTRHGFL